MPKARPKPAADPDADPDRLVRQPDGGYRSADQRFGVEQANGSWFLTDDETADDFGQPRVAGPFATLALVRDAIPRVRSGPTPMRKPIKQGAPDARPARKPPKPETWIDRLAAPDRRRAERMVRTLRSEGLPDAEDLARARIEGKAGTDLARRLLSGRIERLLQESDADEHARQLITDAIQVVAGGRRIGAELPGWALVETEPDGSPTDRRIELD